MCHALFISSFDSFPCAHFVLLTSEVCLYTSQAVPLPLLSTVRKALPIFQNKPRRNVNAAPVSFLLPCLLSAYHFLFPFKTILGISLDAICLYWQPSFSWTVLICFSFFLLWGHRLSAAFLGPSLGLSLSCVCAVLLLLIRHSVCIHACPCPPSFL